MQYNAVWPQYGKELCSTEPWYLVEHTYTLEYLAVVMVIVLAFTWYITAGTAANDMKNETVVHYHTTTKVLLCSSVCCATSSNLDSVRLSTEYSSNVHKRHMFRGLKQLRAREHRLHTHSKQKEDQHLQGQNALGTKNVRRVTQLHIIPGTVLTTQQ